MKQIETPRSPNPIVRRPERRIPDAIVLGRAVGESSSVADLLAYGVAVVALVGVDEAGIWQLFRQGFACLAVGDVAARQHEGNRPPQPVGQSVDLGGTAATRAAYGLAALPPLPPAAQRCARTAEESMSICAGGPPALASARKMSLHTPLAAQRWKRL